jgi:enoyl-CoA hydratase/carnithine racemase
MAERTGPVGVTCDGGVAVVLLQLPERANALGPTLMPALRAALHDLRSRDGVRAVVLAGDGRNFCAGGDLDLPLFDEPDASARLAEIEAAYDITDALLDLEMPVVAAIHGRCAGAGLALALASDVRVATASASFSLEFVRLGLVPDMGLCWLLPAAIGGSRALELALGGEVIGAAQAAEWGLVNRVVPDGTHVDAAIAWCRHVVQFPPGGLAATRRLLREAPRLDRVRAFEQERHVVNALIPTADSQDRLHAFRTRARQGRPQ